MRKLSELHKGESATIAGYSESSNESATLQRLLEMGLIINATVKLCHEAPFGKDPIAIEVRGTLIGIRRSDAAQILVH